MNDLKPGQAHALCQSLHYRYPNCQFLKLLDAPSSSAHINKLVQALSTLNLWDLKIYCNDGWYWTFLKDILTPCLPVLGKHEILQVYFDCERGAWVSDLAINSNK